MLKIGLDSDCQLLIESSKRMVNTKNRNEEAPILVIKL